MYTWFVCIHVHILYHDTKLEHETEWSQGSLQRCRFMSCLTEMPLLRKATVHGATLLNSASTCGGTKGPSGLVVLTKLRLVWQRWRSYVRGRELDTQPLASSFTIDTAINLITHSADLQHLFCRLAKDISWTRQRPHSVDSSSIHRKLTDYGAIHSISGAVYDVYCTCTCTDIVWIEARVSTSFSHASSGVNSRPACIKC